MPYKALLSVSALALADYVLWRWSLSSSREALALVSGLTLPPLALALMWLLGLTFVRLLARGARVPATRLARLGVRGSPSATRAGSERTGTADDPSSGPRRTHAAHREGETASRRKLAA